MAPPKYNFEKMPTKKELQTILKSEKIKFNSSDTKEDLMEVICMDNSLKKKVNICNMGDIHTAMHHDKIMHNGHIYEKTCRSKTSDGMKITSLFKKGASEVEYLVVVATTNGKGLGKAGPKWTVNANKVKIKNIDI